MKYLILEWTPFPGVFGPMHLCQLQEAESKLDFNRMYYHERAIKRGDQLLYNLDDAERIIEYWQKRYPFAEYQLKEMTA